MNLVGKLKRVNRKKRQPIGDVGMGDYVKSSKQLS